MSLTQEEFQYLREMLHQHSAIMLDDGKEYLAESRLHMLATKVGIRSASELMKTIRLDPAHVLRTKVVEAMTTNETSFFRDTNTYDLICKEIIPKLITRRDGSQPIRIWSAASSSGQEAYSVAMMLHTFFPEFCENRFEILATDLSEEMVGRVRNGTYSQLEVNRGVPVSYLIRYFQRTGLDWRVSDSIRGMVKCGTMNLNRPWPSMPPQDLVLMRNVLIYFDATSRKAILNQVARVMSPDGYLILGGSETPLFTSDLFERTNREGSAAYQLKSA